ncbi:glycosyl hydrolase family 26 [Flammeovirgaceae bacterium 311]|nr:glycosyl hydrolase family 26 [Flammeovirgaceae bacterium 311]
MKGTFATLLLLCCSLPLMAQPFKPVNKSASSEAQRLLQYLYQVDDTHILSGQHSYSNDLNRYYNRAQEIAGKYPAIWGTDFIWHGEKDPGQDVVAEAIRKHKEGAIITLMWHAGRPTDKPPFGWKESIQAELTDQEWKDLTTPGTALYKTWEKQADQVATYLKQLQDAQVPVLWRPYHEMNGVWFWWGDKKGPDGFVKLWKMMYDRYVNHHKLNNLIWVWNANAPRDIPKDEAYSYIDFYPGSEYVDVLATDVYHSDYEQKDYQELLDVAGGKVIALGEVGTLPNRHILEAQPKWAWFMVWSNWLETHNKPEQVKEVYELPMTLTRDEIDLKK